MVNAYRSLLTVLLLSLFFQAGCDHSFEPLQEDHPYRFSIHGYLDVSADTQWVRVTPVRGELYAGSDSVEASVKLENPESGETIELRQERRSYREVAHASNFWTEEPIEPEKAYHLRAENREGEFSRVRLQIPADYPVPVLSEDGGAMRLDIEQVDHLAYVQVIYRVTFMGAVSGRYVEVPNIENAERNGDSFSVRIRPPFDELYIEERMEHPVQEITPVQVMIAATDASWPGFHTMDEFVQSLPETGGNVENGIGYLAGLYTRTIPFRVCRDEMPGEPVACGEADPVWR